MYTSFFGLSENPFNLTPDPRYLFLSPHHKEALDHLLYGINERKGFITITGGIGTGKTTLCRALLSHLGSSTKSALIFNAYISDIELLKAVNQEFGIDMDLQTESKKDHIDALNQFLLETFSQGGNAVLLIDEAQNLSHSVLEQIRMLSNLETEREKLIQIVLVGQSELKELLATPSLRQLDERIVVRYDLKPLDSKDIQGYVEHRLVVAGSRGNLRFANGVFKKIYAYSRGNPRRINAVCDRTLLMAYAKEKYTISKGMVSQVIQELRGNVRIEPLVRGLYWKSFASFILIMLLFITAAGVTGWRFRDQILEVLFSHQEPAASRVFKPIESKGPTVVEPKMERGAEPKVEPQMAPKMAPKMEQASGPATLFLDEKTSLAGLFDLFAKKASADNQDLETVPLSLMTFKVQPEYYVLFKKPFRVNLDDAIGAPAKTPRYLLISEVNENGAVALDAEGKERPITRDFILSHWGQKLSCVYTPVNKPMNLLKGMVVPDVLVLQRILYEIGYLVEPTGVYDESTFGSVMKFQKDFGLTADGIAGPRTRALLFQMSKQERP